MYCIYITGAKKSKFFFKKKTAYASAFKNAGIGLLNFISSDLYQRFQKRWYRPF